jgi:undecaprenyl diphosphate synthase
MASTALLPRHIAITMDGNGRWAAARGLPRSAGHKAGLAPVRMCIEQCSRRGVEALTLFAFSSENWRRPAEEVGSLQQKSVRMRFIGERRSLSVRLQSCIAAAEARTAANPGLKLQIAMSYGGRWDIVQAAQQVARECASGRTRAQDLTEESFAGHLSLAGLPEADLLIRTGGEQRISNFLLWDLAYAELHFSPRLWPDFSLSDLEEALAYFASRERRFGRVAAPRSAAKA